MCKLKNWVTNHFTLLMAIFAGGLFFINFIRIFDCNFWLDETYSIDIVHLSLPDMIKTTANDVHPPLYYLILRVFCKIFGYHSYLYHFVSLIPYAIILVFSITKISKTFGKIPALFVITFASILNTSAAFNVQVRMYSWGSLFVLLSFYELYRIYTTNTKSSYILFTVFSLCAAYTHYYLLMAMAGLYASLLIISLINYRSSIKKVLITYGITIIGYLPWLIVLIKTMSKTSSDFWIKTIPSVKECVLYLFSGKLQLPLILFLFVCALFVLLFETGILRFNKTQKNRSKLSINFKELKLTPSSALIISGFVAIFSIILFGIAVSHIIRPMFLVKYLFPVSTIAWLIMGICVSKLKFKNIIASVILLAILGTGMYSFAHIYAEDRATQKILINTLEKTSHLIDEDDIIISTNNHFKEGVARYYYGVDKCFTIEDKNEDGQYELIDEIKNPDTSKKHWLFLEASIDNEKYSQLKSLITAQNYDLNTIIENGNVGTYRVYIYELVYN